MNYPNNSPMQNIKSGSKQNSTFYHYIKTTNEKQDYHEAHNNLSKKYCFHSIYKLQEKVTYKLRQILDWYSKIVLTYIEKKLF